jgi:ubiquinone/menaquinone biosynthesis C-methylase UbiE
MSLWAFLEKQRANRIAMVLEEYKPVVHVDIGCGKNKMILKASTAKNKIGFDPIFGTGIKKTIPLESSSADFVSMTAVLEHLEYPLDVLLECQRILKKGGVLYLTVPNYLAEPFIKIFFKDYGHIFLFGRAQLLGLFSKLEKMKLVSYKRFQFGLNQEVVLVKE